MPGPSATAPPVVDERVVRLVAAQVALVAVVALVTRQWWLALALALGFAGRASGGPRRSLAGRVALSVAPRIGTPRPVPAPPKRFAQAVGLLVSGGAAVAWLLGAPIVAGALLTVLLVAALLEAALGFCIGCRAFVLLMRAGLVPEATCDRCAIASEP